MGGAFSISFGCTEIANRTVCPPLDIGRLSLTSSAPQAGRGVIAALSLQTGGAGLSTHTVPVAVTSSTPTSCSALFWNWKRRCCNCARRSQRIT